MRQIGGEFAEPSPPLDADAAPVGAKRLKDATDVAAVAKVGEISKQRGADGTEARLDEWLKKKAPPRPPKARDITNMP